MGFSTRWQEVRQEVKKSGKKGRKKVKRLEFLLFPKLFTF